MDILVSEQITDLLEPRCKMFHKLMLDSDDTYYDYYKTLNQDQRFQTFIFSILDQNKPFKKYYGNHGIMSPSEFFRQGSRPRSQSEFFSCL